MNIYDVVVIGGGASGIIAALSADMNGAKVLLIEKNNRIGKKILVTGNGRCNYTNVLLDKKDFNNPEFVQGILDQFDVQDTIDFFDSLGISPKVESEGKTYPLSEQASSFLDAFLYELNRRTINIKLSQEVSRVRKRNDFFEVITKEGEKFQGRRVILATGGMAMPLTGCNGSGYEIAKSFSHRITDVFPALVKLKLDSPYLKHLAGVKIDSEVSLIIDGKVQQTEHGDILFANYGISGPTILEISRKANQALKSKQSVELKIVLVQSLDRNKILNRLENFADREIDQSLIGLINKRFINVLIKEAGIEKSNNLVKDVSKQNLNRLINLLFDWRLKVTDSLGFEEAQVTAGGIDVSQVNNITLESKLTKGLFFTGEVLDIDGRCGGFNLQWAWTSGYVAAKHASEVDYDKNN